MNNSYWTESTKHIEIKTEKLSKDIETDVCIIGAGITGISTAYMLTKAGLKVAVLDREPSICARTTANTTGKITSMHGLFYKYLNDSYSPEFAKKYLCANQEAISNIKKIIEEENIDCDFELKDNYIFTKDPGELQKLKDEAKLLSSFRCKRPVCK